MSERLVPSILVLLLLSFAGPDGFARNDLHHRVEITAPDSAGVVRSLESLGFDVAGHDAGSGTVELVVSPSALRQLDAMGLDPKIIGSSSGRSIPPGYRDYAAIVQLMADFETNHPAIARNIDVGAFTGVGNTYENRPIYALKISDNVDQDEDEPAIMIVSCHHAREIATPELAIHAIEQLLDNYGTDPEITALVDNNEIWISPVWNPDGYVYCFDVYDYWRKNRTPFPGGYFGVDLNRNYPYGWNGPYGGSTSPSSDTYKGPMAGSEQETRNMIVLSQNRRFAKVLDFHNYGREVLYTYYLSSALPTEIENYYVAEATELSSEMNYYGYIRKASAEGEHYQWQLNEFGTFAFLAETALDFQPPYNDALYEAQLVWPGVKWFLEHEIPIKGHVTETTSGDPLVADIEISGINYTAGDKRRSGGPEGRFHYFLPPGNYDVTFSATGYSARTVNVDVAADRSLVLETQLGSGPALTVTGHVSPGETLALSFDYPAGANQYYVNGLSLIDTGFTFGNGLFFPIGLDDTLRNTAGHFPGWSGQLDGSGHADAALAIPANPGLVGMTFYMAYLTFTTKWYLPEAASAAVTLVVEE